MSRVGVLMASGTALLAGSAVADQPLATPPATICSLSGSVCATRGQSHVTVWHKAPKGAKRTLWRAPKRAGNLRVADDGLSLVAVQPWANLVERDAGPGTIIFTFFRPDRPPVNVALGAMIRNVAGLPRTVSHRSWATTFGYDGLGHFQVDTVEGRRLLFDPRTGQLVRR